MLFRSGGVSRALEVLVFTFVKTGDAQAVPSKALYLTPSINEQTARIHQSLGAFIIRNGF